MRPVLLVVDMLEDFVRGELGDEKFERIVPPLQKLIKKARENDVPVFYCNDAHKEDDPEIEVWGPHAMKGSEGAEVIEELEPQGPEEIVEKNCYGCFEGTDLEKKLEKTYNGEGADTAIIMGLHTHLCDRHTAYGAFARGYNIIFVEDATDAFTKDQHEKGLKYAKENYNAEIKNTEQIIQEITSQK
ncbi:nicotinamidase [archaeon SCG-AAA382B04]|nr:nicotinamidase [archaeon SCG-AAA382B04]